MTFPVVLDAVARVLREAGLLTELRGDADTEVSGVAHDSRAVRRGDLFLAWKGILADGHDFAPAAAAAGATAMVVERALPEIELPQLVVSDGRHAAALAADAVMGLPGRDLNAVAVTGTNGKTTTALLTRHVLSTRPEGAAAVGTLGVVGPDGRVWSGTEGLTTPDPVSLARWLRRLVDEGTTTVVMEASSHALDQHRLDAIPFRVAVFTNLSRDHLDYHGSLEAYRASKLRLLELLRDDGTVVVNAADPAWRGIDAPSLLTYAVREPADLRAENVVLSPRGTRFTLHFRDEAVPVSLPLLGSFNVENALAAIGAGLALGVPLEAAARRLEDAPQIPGRMERILETPFTVVVDFAHTPDALENLLRAVRAVTQGRLVVLFGAGGDRDRGKREPMAQAVARHADRIFLTSDNPRTEDPERILDDLEPGLGQADHVREADRRSAIRQAVAEAMEGDVLVLAGKGHETYQVIGTEKHPFDERAEVMEALKLRGAA
ncbi:MAG: UDP-N-acetylmuramoyl-L-alanyl-D-glutamate--2,6-diaminopimelate ligase [Gemmatimonadales bacterium]|nr:MAG: UDP-N-acetylmuramoyl-L-alanyl-D-glutamate--2,6-diaminopimelate ligase [Gemmatimonadales bacterium]